MTKLGFYGACGVVTGSCNWVKKSSEPPFLVDCGMFQGPDELETLNAMPLGFEASMLQGVVLTHAHLDHCGRLPLLTNLGFVGAVYMTHATRELVELTLRDAAKIQQFEDDKVLFDEVAVEKLLDQVIIVNYHETFALGGFEAMLVDAGHILGAGTVVLKDKKSGEVIIFSGDLGNSPQDLIKPTELVNQAQVVVMESTYGDKNHPQENVKERMGTVVREIEKNGGTLLIPAFSIERTQEILHLFDHLKKEGRMEETTGVFLDSPMGIEATRIFKRYQNLYSQELKKHSKSDDPFSFPGLFVTQRNRQSEAIDEYQGPKVIIAGAGMMTGGRIVRHASKYLQMDSTILLFTGYQGVETLGREIQEGAREVEIDGYIVPVKAKVMTISALSSHAGQSDLIKWLEHIQGLRMVFLNHGDEEARRALKELVQLRHENLLVDLPGMGEVVNV